MYILVGFTSSLFQDFKSFHSTKVVLVEDVIRLVLDENESSFISYELRPELYTFKEISEVLSKILQPDDEGFHYAIDFEFDDTTMKKNGYESGNYSHLGLMKNRFLKLT